MSVEFIAESLLRRAKPRSPVLKDWISSILKDPKFHGPPLVSYKMNAILDDEKANDDAIYELARQLVDFRDVGTFDKPLSEEIMKYYDHVCEVVAKKAKKSGYGAGRYGSKKRFWRH